MNVGQKVTGQKVTGYLDYDYNVYIIIYNSTFMCQCCVLRSHYKLYTKSNLSFIDTHAQGIWNSI